jgi:Spy/CpxP family protein refolding chaperone
MDKKILVVVLVISVAINLATVFTLGYFWWTRHGVARQDVFIRPNMMHELHQTRMARELNLSDRQIEEMKKVNEEMRLAMQPLREALFKKRQALMSLLRDEDMERAKADVLIEQIARLQAEHDAQIFDRILLMKRILTPEQQQRLGALMHTLLESGRPPEMPHAPVHPHRPFELPRGEKGQ